MRKTGRINPATFGGLFLAGVACIALAGIPAQGGSMGNGKPRPVGQFIFCYGGNVKVVYMTQVMPMAAMSPPNRGVGFGKYVQATYGIPSVDRERCVTGNTAAELTAERERDKGMFGKTKVVEINWAE